MVCRIISYRSWYIAVCNLVVLFQDASAQRLERIHSKDMLSMIVNAHCSNSPCGSQGRAQGGGDWV